MKGHDWRPVYANGMRVRVTGFECSRCGIKKRQGQFSIPFSIIKSLVIPYRDDYDVTSIVMAMDCDEIVARTVMES